MLCQTVFQTITLTTCVAMIEQCITFSMTTCVVMIAVNWLTMVSSQLFCGAGTHTSNVICQRVDTEWLIHSYLTSVLSVQMLVYYCGPNYIFTTFYFHEFFELAKLAKTKWSQNFWFYSILMIFVRNMYAL